MRDWPSKVELPARWRAEAQVTAPAAQAVASDARPTRADRRITQCKGQVAKRLHNVGGGAGDGSTGEAEMTWVDNEDDEQPDVYNLGEE